MRPRPRQRRRGRKAGVIVAGTLAAGLGFHQFLNWAARIPEPKKGPLKRAVKHESGKTKPGDFPTTHQLTWDEVHRQIREDIERRGKKSAKKKPKPDKKPVVRPLSDIGVYEFVEALKLYEVEHFKRNPLTSYFATQCLPLLDEGLYKQLNSEFEHAYRGVLHGHTKIRTPDGSWESPREIGDLLVVTREWANDGTHRTQGDAEKAYFRQISNRFLREKDWFFHARLKELGYRLTSQHGDGRSSNHTYRLEKTGFVGIDGSNDVSVVTRKKVNQYWAEK